MPSIQRPVRLSDLLFVYGSLRRGSDHGHAARLARESDWLGHASLTGTLYRVSWYPALVIGGTDEVTGDLLRLHDPVASLAWLDAFEGCASDEPEPHEYRRESATVATPDGAAAAMAYLWNLPVIGLERIASGDWLAA